MPKPVKIAFQSDIVEIEIASLIPVKDVSATDRRDQKYKQIAASLKHVGLIEPIVVFQSGRGKYLVVEGHKRLDILKSRGATEVRCLLATDDESYTYNKRVNYLRPIGEHHMILRALANGVTESRIAAALDVDITTIRRKRNLLVGICPEAVEVLKDRRVNPNAFASLRRMKPVRQVEVAELMVANRNYTQRFAQALLFGTRAEFLVDPKRVRASRRVPLAQKTMIEQETDVLLREFKSVEASFGTDILSLKVSCGYVKRLLNNARVERYLTKHHTDILTQLRKLVAEVDSDKRVPRKPPAKEVPAPRPQTPTAKQPVVPTVRLMKSDR